MISDVYGEHQLPVNAEQYYRMQAERHRVHAESLIFMIHDAAKRGCRQCGGSGIHLNALCDCITGPRPAPKLSMEIVDDEL